MENRSENRSTNCKNQTSNRTSNKTTNSATNEHKHPNQYTKGADDERQELHQQPFHQRKKQPLMA